MIVMLKRFKICHETHKPTKLENLIKINFKGENVGPYVSSKYYNSKNLEYTPFALMVTIFFLS